VFRSKGHVENDLGSHGRYSVSYCLLRGE
jgi:hypothetical protein